MIDGAHPVGEGGDRYIVGEVDSLSFDVTAVVGGRELGFVPSGRDDPCAFRLCQQSDRTRNPAATADHQDGLVLQRVTHPHPSFAPPARRRVAGRPGSPKLG
jgi:hypothetical protein